MERGQRVAGVAVASACLLTSFTLLHLSRTRYDDGWALEPCSALGAAYAALALIEGWRVVAHVAWREAGWKARRTRLRRTLHWILLPPLPLLILALDGAIRAGARWSMGPAFEKGDRVREARHESESQRLWVFTDRAVYIGEIESGYWRIPYPQVENWVQEPSGRPRGVRLTLTMSAPHAGRAVSGIFTGYAGRRIERLLCRVVRNLRASP